MGIKKKIRKSIEIFDKRIKEHEEKIETYKQSGGVNYALLDYWEKEIETFKKIKEDEEKKGE